MVSDRSLDPKELDVLAIKLVYKLVNVPPGNVQFLLQGKEVAVRTLLEATTEYGKKFLVAQQKLKEGISFWGEPFIEAHQQEAYLEKLKAGQDFFDSLLVYNRPEKFKSFPYNPIDIEAQKEQIVTLNEVNQKIEFCNRFYALTHWLDLAVAYLEEAAPWVKKVQQKRKSLLTGIIPKAPELKKELESLKESYIREYLAWHQKMRLEDDKAKQNLLKDERLNTLSQLSSLSLFPAQKVVAIRDRINQVKVCSHLTEEDLQKTPICPHCRYRPTLEKVGAQERLHLEEQTCEDLLNQWLYTLSEKLKDQISTLPIVQEVLNSRQISEEAMTVLQNLFKDVHSVVIVPHEIEKVLKEGSAPEIKEQFNQYIDQLVKGQENVQIVIES